MNTNLPIVDPIAAIEHWLDAMVIGQNLCPFASSARRKGLVRIVVADTDSEAQCLQQLADEANRLETIEGDATTLFVLPRGFEDFDDYLDLLAVADALMEDLDFEGILQLASFHPDYQFDGTDYDDVSNWTNRSPLPILHLLKEDAVSRAVDAHPDPEGIPARNVEKLEQLGLAGILQILNSGD
ncbi:DUF1415 domain-containing protein [Granulosicoccus antarcticus]|uniref:DUF1415 domain-containing protein n=1 Tax=Granulosicoccus antarcticus IMCC3135 TaxID=1192854 RepID=A0A2Z2NVK2_9GAMM|nr:DUF1415 domain-containing protein [Granulosicoccus antarcticus]ASJ75273.1 hypothetical protein IMCC3135_26090 [Granulosicoccus antarcticus IMCC3135]